MSDHTHQHTFSPGSPENDAIAKKLTAVGIGGNIALSALKVAAGILGGSAAMISDAVHSLSDVFATAIAYIGVRIAAKDEDEGHPYGHERYECLASLILALILTVAGLGIGLAGMVSILQQTGLAAALGLHLADPEPNDAPLAIALAAAIISILTKEGMYRYTMHWATVMHSPAFQADAKHHRSDAYSSIGALVGIGATMLGFPLGDPIASVIICAFILKMAWEITTDAVDRMVDAPCDKQTEEAIRQCLSAQEGVIRVDLLQTRMFGARSYVDAEIAVDGTLPLVDAHEIAEKAHDAVEQQFPQVKHVMIHVNPA